MSDNQCEKKQCDTSCETFKKCSKCDKCQCTKCACKGEECKDCDCKECDCEKS